MDAKSWKTMKRRWDFLRESEFASSRRVRRGGRAMQLSKPVAAIVLLATLLPFVYFVFFIATIFMTILSGPVSGPMPTSFKLIFVLHVLCILWIWALVAFYLVYLFTTSAVPQDKKALWAVVLLFANLMAM